MPRVRWLSFLDPEDIVLALLLLLVYADLGQGSLSHQFLSLPSNIRLLASLPVFFGYIICLTFPPLAGPGHGFIALLVRRVIQLLPLAGYPLLSHLLMARDEGQGIRLLLLFAVSILALGVSYIPGTRAASLSLRRVLMFPLTVLNSLYVSNLLHTYIAPTQDLQRLFGQQAESPSTQLAVAFEMVARALIFMAVPHFTLVEAPKALFNRPSWPSSFGEISDFFRRWALRYGLFLSALAAEILLSL